MSQSSPIWVEVAMFRHAFVLGNLLLLVASLPTKKDDGTRIVGGHAIDITEAPYQISLQYRGRHTCGGSIISEDLIVTAAHCVIGSQASIYTVRAGSSSLNSGGIEVQVADIVWHNGFTYSKMDYDVALLLLKEPLVFDENISAIDLDDDGYEIEDGDLTIITGWGHTKESGGILPSNLQSVAVPTVGNAECSEAYSPYYSITPRMLCAGIPEGGKDACQGDSGGPLIHDNKLSGIVSWGIGCARPDYPGVYAKVSALRTWIDEKSDYLRTKKILRGF